MSIKTRDYIITFNLEKDSIENFFDSIFPSLSNCYYLIGGPEIGDNHCYKHCHMFFHFRNPVSFESLQKKFKIHHIETRKGTIQECVNYCIKPDTKLDPSCLVLKNTLPEELYIEKESIYDMLISDILCGLSLVEVIKKYPKIALYNYNNLQKLYYTLNTNDNINEN